MRKFIFITKCFPNNYICTFGPYCYLWYTIYYYLSPFIFATAKMGGDFSFIVSRGQQYSVSVCHLQFVMSSKCNKSPWSESYLQRQGEETTGNSGSNDFAGITYLELFLFSLEINFTAIDISVINFCFFF